MWALGSYQLSGNTISGTFKQSDQKAVSLVGTSSQHVSPDKLAAVIRRAGGNLLSKPLVELVTFQLLLQMRFRVACEVQKL